MDAGGGRRLDDFFVRGLRIAVDDIFPHGAGEQHRFLGHIAHPVGQLDAGELGDVGAVQQHPPAGRGIEALDDLQQRRLAAAVAPHQGVNAAGFDGDRHAVDHRRHVLAESESDALQLDLAGRAFHLDFAFLALALDGENFTQTVDRLLEAVEGAPLPDQLIERPQKPATQHVGGDQRPHGHRLVDDGDGADGRHAQRSEHGQAAAEVGKGVGLGPAHDRLFDIFGVFFRPNRPHGLIQRQRLDGGAAVDHFGDQAVAALRRLALCLVGGGHGGARFPGHEHESRNDDQKDPGDGQRDDQDHAQKHEGERQVRHQQRRGAGKRVANHVDVAEKRLPVVRRLGLKHVQRQRHQLVEQALPDQNIDPQGHRLHDPGPGHAQDVVEDYDENHADGQAPKGADSGAGDHPVVDLEREHRHRERQQVDEKRHRQNLAENRLQRLHEGLEPGA